jgi:hypothetical protein
MKPPNVPVIRLDALRRRGMENRLLEAAGVPDDEQDDGHVCDAEAIRAGAPVGGGIVDRVVGGYEEVAGHCCSNAERVAIALDPFRGGRMVEDRFGRRSWTTPGQRRQITADLSGGRDDPRGMTSLLNGGLRGVPRIR